MEPIEMDRPTFEAACALSLPQPDVATLASRFKWARDRTAGNGDAAMAAVNEVLAAPITFDEFIDLLAHAA